MVRQVQLMSDTEFAQFKNWIKADPPYDFVSRTYAEQFMVQELGMDREQIRKKYYEEIPVTPVMKQVDLGSPVAIIRLQDPERWVMVDDQNNHLGKPFRRKKQIMGEYNLKVTKRVDEGRYEVKVISE